MVDITLAQLLEAGVHFGHKAYRWNPKMFPYIYTERNNIHILDLVQSAQLLKEANSYVQLEAEKDKTFLFIGTKRQASTLIAQEAETKQIREGARDQEGLPKPRGGWGGPPRVRAELLKFIVIVFIYSTYSGMQIRYLWHKKLM